MNFARRLLAAFFAALFLASTLPAAPAPLDPGALPPSWRDRLAALAAPSALVAPFVETREIPLKKRPVVVEGVVRLARGHGLSLDYTRSRSPLVILDDRGLLLRHPDGREQTPPPEAAESLRLLHALFAFDLPVLSQAYQISGEESADGGWTLLFSRRADSNAHYRELLLTGDASRLIRIRLVQTERQTTTIELGPPRLDPVFTPEELARWFR